jgi:pyruvate formate lyase activating enzyme
MAYIYDNLSMILYETGEIQMAAETGKMSTDPRLSRTKYPQRNEPAGYVASIKRYMIHDGPGIRTVVFMKGCPLRCLWCSSPQTWSTEPAVIFVKSRCIGCGLCVEECPEDAIHESGELKVIDRSTCSLCGQCTQICPTEAMKFDGILMTLPEVMETIEKDRAFYDKSGGGVTFSGGEPTYQWEFLHEMLKSCHAAGIHTALETTGHVEWHIFEQLLPFIDLLLYDVKLTDPQAHAKLTGKPNELILNNLRRIVDRQKPPIEIHFPVIPGCNDSQSNIDALLDIMKSLGLRKIDLFPFHLLGSHEYEELGIEYAMKYTMVPPDEDIGRIREYITSRGFELVT